MTSISQPNQVTLIVLNYNDHQVTADFCLTMSNFECINNLVIVDNHSSDDSFAHLSQLKSDKIHVIQADENGGYAKGNNAGLYYCEKFIKTDLVIISNPDIQIDELTLKKCLDFINNNKTKTGLVSPKMKMLKSDMPVAWKLPTYGTFLIRALIPIRPLFDRFYHYDASTINAAVVPVDVLPGSLLIAQFDTLKLVGYFDERTFLFGEENILSYKLKLHGFQNYLLGNLFYIHAHSLSINKNIKSISKKFNIALESDLIYLRFYLKVGPFRLFLLKWIYKFGVLLFLILKLIQMITRKDLKQQF